MEFARVNYASALRSLDSSGPKRVPSKTLATLATVCWGVTFSLDNHLPINWRIWRIPSSALISGVIVIKSKPFPYSSLSAWRSDFSAEKATPAAKGSESILKRQLAPFGCPLRSTIFNLPNRGRSVSPSRRRRSMISSAQASKKRFTVSCDSPIRVAIAAITACLLIGCCSSGPRSPRPTHTG